MTLRSLLLSLHTYALQLEFPYFANCWCTYVLMHKYLYPPCRIRNATFVYGGVTHRHGVFVCCSWMLRRSDFAFINCYRHVAPLKFYAGTILPVPLHVASLHTIPHTNYIRLSSICSTAHKRLGPFSFSFFNSRKYS